MYNEQNKEFTFKNGKILTKGTLPLQPRLFCDERTYFEVNNDVLTMVGYYNPQFGRNNIQLRSNFFDTTAFYIETEKENYGLNLTKTEMLPFGFKALCPVEGAEHEFSIYTVNNAIIFTLKTPKDMKYKAKMHFQIRKKCFFFPIKNTSDFANPQLNGEERNWNGFTFENNLFKANSSSPEFPEGTGTHITFSCNKKTKLRVTPRNIKYDFILENLKADTEYKFVMAFSYTDELSTALCKDMLKNSGTYIEERKKEYADVYRKAPKFNTGNKSIDNFMGMVPLFTRSLKTTEISGNLRANTMHYWGWGSDNLVESASYFLSGDNDYAREIIDLATKLGKHYICSYDKTCTKNAHKEEKFSCRSDFPFVIHTYEYWVGGGNLDDDLYNLCKSLYLESKELIDEKTGLYHSGMWFAFDYSSAFKSTFIPDEFYGCCENVMMYIGLRGIQSMAYYKKDFETVKEIAEVTSKIEKNLVKTFYNPKEKYFSGAVNDKNLKRMESYTSYMQRYENDFGTDILEEKFNECADYYEKNFITTNGIRAISKDHEAFDGDDNQMHCWWPCYNCDYFIRMMQMTNRTENIDKYVSWIAFWSDRITMPEGMDLYDSNSQNGYDDWNMRCGAWQQFAYRAFYQSIVRGLYGVEFDDAGVTFYPYSGTNVSVTNLHGLNKTFDIEFKGKGKYFKKIVLNGKTFLHTNRLPKEELLKKNVITVYRTDVEPLLTVSALNGTEIKNYAENKDGIKFTAVIAGNATLKLSGKVNEVLLDGKKQKTEKSNLNKTVVRLTAIGEVGIEIR